jgi:D-3-phosphoglycerate dehydrogenase
VTLWLAAARKITKYDAATRRGEWHWQTGKPIKALRGSVLGLLSPLTDETRGLFDEDVLRRMKRSAILINTARGPIVSDRALCRALTEGWIAGAALDDLEEEPAKQRDWKPDNPLLRLDNVIVTPHVAYYSEESIRMVRTMAANEVVRVLTGQQPRSPVNVVERSHAVIG